MAFERKIGLIGVSFAGNKLKLVEVESIGGQYQINRIIQKNANLSLNIIEQSVKGDSAAVSIGNLINDTLHLTELQINQATFSLDSQLVLIKKVPVDSDLPMQEIQNQVQWEAEQFVFHPIENYIIDYNHFIQSKDHPDANDLLIVMVRKSIIDFIQKIFDQTQLDLKIVDVDIFAAIRAVKSNYEYQRDEKIGLVDISNEGVKIILMTNGEYFVVTDFSFATAEHGKKTEIVPDDTQLAKLIVKEFRKVLLDYQLGKRIEDLDRIFLYGEMVQPRLVESLQNLNDVRITKVNPFRKVRFFSTDVDNEWVRNSPEMFAVCIGAALRTS